MNRSKEQGRLLSCLARPILVGLAVGVAAGAVLLLLAAAIMVWVQIPETFTVPIAFAAIAVSAAVGGFTAARMLRERGWLVGVAVGLLLFLVVTLAGVGAPIHGSRLLLKLVLSVFGGALGGIAGVNVKRR